MLGRDVATLAQRPTAPQSMPMVAVRGWPATQSGRWT